MLVNVAIVIATVVMIVRNNSRHCNNRFLASIYIYIYVSIYLCIYVCIYLSIYVSIYLSIYLSISSDALNRTTRDIECFLRKEYASSDFMQPQDQKHKMDICIYVCIYIYICICILLFQYY